MHFQPKNTKSKTIIMGQITFDRLVDFGKMQLRLIHQKSHGMTSQIGALKMNTNYLSFKPLLKNVKCEIIGWCVSPGNAF